MVRHFQHIAGQIPLLEQFKEPVVFRVRRKEKTRLPIFHADNEGHIVGSILPCVRMLRRVNGVLRAINGKGHVLRQHHRLNALAFQRIAVLPHLFAVLFPSAFVHRAHAERFEHFIGPAHVILIEVRDDHNVDVRNVPGAQKIHQIFARFIFAGINHHNAMFRQQNGSVRLAHIQKHHFQPFAFFPRAPRRAKEHQKYAEHCQAFPKHSVPPARPITAKRRWIGAL